MKKETKDKHFIKQPWYEGGAKALKKFIGENLVYPEDALQNKVEGTVFVKYDIDYQGKVVDARVITGIGYGCDEEALRLVKMLKFKVEKPRGVRVLFHNSIQIHFRLPAQAPSPQTGFVYHYTQTGIDTEEKEDSPQPSYHYTITFNAG